MNDRNFVSGQKNPKIVFFFSNVQKCILIHSIKFCKIQNVRICPFKNHFLNHLMLSASRFLSWAQSIVWSEKSKPKKNFKLIKINFQREQTGKLLLSNVALSFLQCLFYAKIQTKNGRFVFRFQNIFQISIDKWLSLNKHYWRHTDCRQMKIAFTSALACSGTHNPRVDSSLYFLSSKHTLCISARVLELIQPISTEPNLRNEDQKQMIVNSLQFYDFRFDLTLFSFRKIKYSFPKLRPKFTFTLNGKKCLLIPWYRFFFLFDVVLFCMHKLLKMRFICCWCNFQIAFAELIFFYFVFYFAELVFILRFIFYFYFSLIFR